MTLLRGSCSSVEFGPGRPTLLINDQVRVYDQAPQALGELRSGSANYLVSVARAGTAAGCGATDVLLDHPDVDETAALPLVCRAIDEAVGCPLCIDSRRPEAIDAALDGYRGKALLNSVTGERESLRTLLPVAARHGMAVVALLIDGTAIPATWQARLRLAREILAHTDAAGIPRDDVVFDAVCMAAATEVGAMAVTLDTLAAIHGELNMSTLLGIGNAGYGMPTPTRIDLTFLLAAIPRGLDAALVDYRTENLHSLTRAADFLAGRDPLGAGYVGLYRRQRKAATEKERVLASTG
jgi:5-methyltetrahydrofolate--homocysteine methyltransferase